jgi:hypothetical protein
MSASFSPAIHKQIGPFDLKNMKEDDLLRLICRCEPAWIHASQKLEDPTARVVRIDDGDIALFLNGVLEPTDVMYLNALNFKRKSWFTYI